MHGDVVGFAGRGVVEPRYTGVSDCRAAAGRAGRKNRISRGAFARSPLSVITFRQTRRFLPRGMVSPLLTQRPIDLMNAPTHEEIAQRAHQIWQDSGCAGNADAHWFEAERQLSEITFSPRAHPGTPVSSPQETLSEGRRPDAIEQREAQQKREARAPQRPTHTAPTTVPAQTGKPLWSQPHSS